jgi:hypothetical protein
MTYVLYIGMHTNGADYHIPLGSMGVLHDECRLLGSHLLASAEPCREINIAKVVFYSRELVATFGFRNRELGSVLACAD